jgi:hypothetical protein
MKHKPTGAVPHTERARKRTMREEAIYREAYDKGYALGFKNGEYAANARWWKKEGKQ